MTLTWAKIELAVGWYIVGLLAAAAGYADAWALATIVIVVLLVTAATLRARGS